MVSLKSTSQDLVGRGIKTQLLPFQSFILCININFFFFLTEDYQNCHGSADKHCGSFWLKEVQGGYHKVLFLISMSPCPLKLTEKPLEVLHVPFENDLWACLMWLLYFSNIVTFFISTIRLQMSRCIAVSCISL